jgi:predicted KAP-like P-loop ATPase
MEPLKYAKYIFPILGISEEIKPAIEDMAKAFKISSDNDIFDPISQKEKISQALKDIEYKILIVIDDIDRLNKDEICQIFQLVKSVADFPNTIYILSFSPDVVTTSLAGIQGIEGRKYLEKIVQYPIEIPSVSQEALESYLFKEIYEIIDRDSNLFSEKKFATLFCDYNFRLYFENLREIKRFLNVFRFDFDLLLNEVDIVDLIFISAIKSLDSYFYNYIKDNKYMFVGGKDRYDSLNLARTDKYQQILETDLDINQKHIRKYKVIKSCLSYIFPYVDRTKYFHININYFNIKYRRTGGATRTGEKLT